MKQLKKTLLTLVALLAVTTGAWAQNYLYFEVDGTSATVMYGDKGSNPYYDTDGHGGYGWWVAGSPYSGKNELTTVTIDASCQNFTGTILQSLFDNWLVLTTINNLENLNTSEVTSMKRMFVGCSALTSLDPSSLNTAKVTNMEQMFRGLPVETLDLSGFNTSSVTNMYAMFYDCIKLETIYVGDGWSTASVTDGSYMFDNCSKLPGYNSGKVTQEMAKLTTDGGYLQVKPAAGTPVPLTWDAANPNTATLTNGMPAGNVTVSVEYYPQATMAEGAVTAAKDVKATTEDALVTIDKSKLTGVAKLMYYVSTEATAPDYDAEGWTDVLPTAANYTKAADLNVWYYAVGVDSDDPTETYSDGDICAKALTVTLGDAPLWNAEFDLTDAPEEDKAGKWSTNIPEGGVMKGTPVTVTYTGSKKIIGVKAEKKSSAPTLKDALKDGATVVIDYVWDGEYKTTFTYTNNGGKYTGNTTGVEAEYFANGMSMEGTTLKFWASNMDYSDANVSIDFDTDANEYVAMKGDFFTSFTISVNGTDITSQLTKVK